MNRFYVVGIDKVTPDEAAKFIEKFDDAQTGWWHWINDMWLIATSSEKLNSEKLRDLARQVTSERDADLLVLEVDPLTWHGYGPHTKDKNMFTWIKSTWSPNKSDQ